MHFTLPILLSVLAPTFVASAPALDAATLLQNGQAAQKLNAEFQNLSTTDSCQTGETACIMNAIATCKNGQFDTSTGLCKKTQSCFALPNVRAEGTILQCTSLSSALSLINATGATGGLTGNNNTNSSQGSNTAAGSSSGKMKQDPNNLTSATALASQTEAPGIVTVTVTLTATPAPVTVEASTQTLSPEQASSLLFSILGQVSATSDSSVPTASAPNASASEATTTSATALALATPSTIIQLTAAQISESLPLSSTFAASTPIASATLSNDTQLTAAQITESAVPASSPTVAAAVVTSAAASSSSDGYDSGGYGGY